MIDFVVSLSTPSPPLLSFKQFCGTPLRSLVEDLNGMMAAIANGCPTLPSPHSFCLQ